MVSSIYICFNKRIWAQKSRLRLLIYISRCPTQFLMYQSSGNQNSVRLYRDWWGCFINTWNNLPFQNSIFTIPLTSSIPIIKLWYPFNCQLVFINILNYDRLTISIGSFFSLLKFEPFEFYEVEFHKYSKLVSKQWVISLLFSSHYSLITQIGIFFRCLVGDWYCCAGCLNNDYCTIKW